MKRMLGQRFPRRKLGMKMGIAENRGRNLGNTFIFTNAACEIWGRKKLAVKPKKSRSYFYVNIQMFT